MTLIPDDISLTSCDAGRPYPAAKKSVANEIPLIPVSGNKGVDGATQQIAEGHL